MHLTAYFSRLARYHAWATRRLLADDLAALGDEAWHRDLGLFFPQAWQPRVAAFLDAHGFPEPPRTARSAPAQPATAPAPSAEDSP